MRALINQKHDSSSLLDAALCDKQGRGSYSSSQFSPNDQIQQQISTQSCSPEEIFSADCIQPPPSLNSSINDNISQSEQNSDSSRCSDIEVFPKYLPPFSEMYLSNIDFSNEQNQKNLFDGKPEYVPHYGYSTVQSMINLQKKYIVQEVTDFHELKLREECVDLMSSMNSLLKLTNQTFFLGSNIFALYLNYEQDFQFLPQNQQIILITTCLFIAAKYEEIYPPSLQDFVQQLAKQIEKNEFRNYLSNKSSHQLSFYTQNILEFEGEILIKLSFSLFGPTRLGFFEAFLSQIQLDSFQVNFCLYLLELSQMNHSLYKYSHSKIAASSILLSEKFKNMQGKYFWSPELELITDLRQPDLYACVEDLYSYLLQISQKNRKSHIFLKYSDPNLNEISLINYDLPDNSQQQTKKQKNQKTQYQEQVSSIPLSENQYPKFTPNANDISSSIDYLDFNNHHNQCTQHDFSFDFNQRSTCSNYVENHFNNSQEFLPKNNLQPISFSYQSSQTLPQQQQQKQYQQLFESHQQTIFIDAECSYDPFNIVQPQQVIQTAQPSLLNYNSYQDKENIPPQNSLVNFSEIKYQQQTVTNFQNQQYQDEIYFIDDCDIAAYLQSSNQLIKINEECNKY